MILRRSESIVSVRSVRTQRRVVGIAAGAMVVVVAAVLVAFAAATSSGASVALVVLIGAIVAAAIRPISGVYAMVFFTLVGDGETSDWFPFAKTLSSRESLLFLSEKLFVTPLEILIWMTMLFFLLEVFGGRKRKLVKGPLWVAVTVFTGFVVLGFMYGIARGGDPRVSLFEGRNLFILLPVYTLIINLCDKVALRRLMWTAIAAIFINALLALNFLNGLSFVQRQTREDLGEHAASVHWNIILLLTLTLLLFRMGAAWQRLMLLAMCVPVMIVYLAAQRRAAVAGLVVGIALVLVTLWWHQRGKFLVIVPVLLVATAGYTAAFWNSTSSAAFPAQAIKTIIAPEEVSEDDRGSDQYRVAENFDLNFTIRSEPVFGLGFGHQFYTPVPLPDLSFFEFYQYIPHNSLLWIWIKMGFGGFAAMLVMFALALRTGAQTMVSRADFDGRVMALIGSAYTMMYVVFAFVDISWDPRSLVFLAVAFALSSQIERDPLPVEESSKPRLELRSVH